MERAGRIVGFTLANRRFRLDIERENALYLNAVQSL